MMRFSYGTLQKPSFLHQQYSCESVRAKNSTSHTLTLWHCNKLTSPRLSVSYIMGCLEPEQSVRECYL